MRVMWWMLARIGETMSERQKKAAVAKMQEDLIDEMTPHRRDRSSPRAVRQPVCGWPRKLRNQTWKGGAQYEILHKQQGLS